MSSRAIDSPGRGGGRRSVHLRLAADVAESTTSLVHPDGSRTVATERASYRATPHGLSKWTDPVDGRGYVIGSGALDGATHFVAGTDGPADRLPTDVTVEPNAPTDVVRATGGDVASHHLGLVAGPWRVHAGPGVEVLGRQALDRAEHLGVLVEDTRRALDWLLDWFGEPAAAAPWGDVYTQVLVPEAPWFAMEHPGCVLLSERVLDAPTGQRLAVVAHEAAHQWLGNLVSPRTWSDVGAFEGLAELLGQLAAQALGGAGTVGAVARRRAARPLATAPTPIDLRTLAATAGLAEVAGPVQHAELFRAVRAEDGAAEFRTRVRDLVARYAGSTCGTAEVWSALGRAEQRPRSLVLPAVAGASRAAWVVGLDGGGDPASSARRARRAFRDRGPGGARVREALVALSDPRTPYPVVAGLAAELSRPRSEQKRLLV